MKFFKSILSLPKEFKEFQRNKTLMEFQKYALDNSAIVEIFDDNGIIIYANDKFCEVTGYTKEELIGSDHKKFHSGYHSKEFIKDIWDTVKSGKVWKNAILNKTKDDKKIWLDTTIVPLGNREGVGNQFISIKYDITIQKQNQDELRKLIRAVEQSPVSIVITDVYGIIEYVNPKF